ncbi:MAG: DUF2934 domain-containing protein [Candidatus Tantalella remota]|nr:DUF2934 domain-containing protein [Candidatus Tantalella remota]
MMKRVIKKFTKKATAKKATTTAKTKKRTTKKTSKDDLFSLIEKKAYEFYQERGYNHGEDQNDWLEAEKIVLKKAKV